VNKAKVASAAVGQMLDTIYEWEHAADVFFATGSDDDDVVVTHDSRGALIEVVFRPGLQNDLTVEELETAINDAIDANKARWQEGLASIDEQFQARFERIGAVVGPHPVGDQFVEALAAGKN